MTNWSLYQTCAYFDRSSFRILCSFCWSLFSPILSPGTNASKILSIFLPLNDLVHSHSLQHLEDRFPSPCLANPPQTHHLSQSCRALKSRLCTCWASSKSGKTFCYSCFECRLDFLAFTSSNLNKCLWSRKFFDGALIWCYLKIGSNSWWFLCRRDLRAYCWTYSRKAWGLYL